jgi:hypothetical protein
MPPWLVRQRLALVTLAVLFVAAAVFYTGISLYYYSRPLGSVTPGSWRSSSAAWRPVHGR